MARTLKGVDAHGAAKLMKDGALMLDVREPGEYARSQIAGSLNAPLSRLEGTPLPLGDGQAIVFFCASGGRTTVSAARLATKAGSADAYVLQGGISAWGQAGLPVASGSQDEGGAPRGFFSRMFG